MTGTCKKQAHTHKQLTYTHKKLTYVGLDRTIYIYGYILCIYGIIGREITKLTATYGVYKRFWPTLDIHKSRMRASPMHVAYTCL
jgi:hypothetical protein